MNLNVVVLRIRPTLYRHCEMDSNVTYVSIGQLAQLSQRDRAAGWVGYGQKWKTGTGRQYFTDIIGLSSTTVTSLASKAIELGEKRKIRAIMPFKVIHGHQGRYQSKARMRLTISDQYN